MSPGTTASASKSTYRMGSAQKRYRPDFIVQVDDGKRDPLNLIVEIKGYRREGV